MNKRTMAVCSDKAVCRGRSSGTHKPPSQWLTRIVSDTATVLFTVLGDFFYH